MVRIASPAIGKIPTRSIYSNINPVIQTTPNLGQVASTAGNILGGSLAMVILIMVGIFMFAGGGAKPSKAEV